jgi:hypothetical protein
MSSHRPFYGYKEFNMYPLKDSIGPIANEWIILG